MRRGRVVVVVLVAALTALGGPGRATAAPPAADPGGWQGPSPVDPGAYDASDPTGVADDRGATVVWFDGDSALVSHRDPGAGSTWSVPRELPGSAGRARSRTPASPFLLTALPSGDVLVLGDSARGSSGSAHSLWRISPDGVPSARMDFPFDRLTPGLLRVRGERWLVTGTATGYSGSAFAATRGPGGRWRLSEQFPVHRSVNPVTAYVDAEGVVHLLAVAATAHIPDTDLRRGAYPIYEAELRPDGSWADRDLAVRTFSPNAVGDANADGDVSVAYRRENQRSDVWTRIRTLPAGSDDWSAPVRVREQYPQVDVAVADDGSTVVLRRGGPAGLRVGRLDPAGALDGWQRLARAREAFGDPALSLDGSGSAVVSARGGGGAAGPGPIERTWRCAAGAACEAMGDRAAATYATPVLASSPDGEVHQWWNSHEDCAGAALCSWWHAAPPGPPAD